MSDRGTLPTRRVWWRIVLSALLCWSFSWWVITSGHQWPWLAAVFVGPLWMTFGAAVSMVIEQRRGE